MSRVINYSTMEVSLDDLQHLLKEYNFVSNSYDLYNGCAGTQDFGPVGTQLKNRIIDLWRDIFLCSNETILEIDTSIFTPASVLYASGHVSHFTDLVAYDKFGRHDRADHLVTDFLTKLMEAAPSPELEKDLRDVDTYNEEQMLNIIQKYRVTFPDSEEPLIKVEQRNNMFQVKSHGYENLFLRPELAQGVFMNYHKVAKMVRNQLPFGMCQIGKSFRYEVSTTSFTRMREFTQMEIEYFVDPDELNTVEVPDVSIPLWSAAAQETGAELAWTNVRTACEKGTIIHKTMALFVAKIYQFAVKLGLNKDLIRLRQHRTTEMAHYAKDCWDLEVKVGSKWLECVGCADRGSYDLLAHQKASRTNFGIRVIQDPPIEIEQLEMKLNKGLIGKTFKKDAKSVMEHLSLFRKDTLEEVRSLFEKGENLVYKAEDKDLLITLDMLQINTVTVRKGYKEVMPRVIEPSFGLDRLMYALLVHSAWKRKPTLMHSGTDERIVLSLPVNIAPYQYSIFTLSNHPELLKFSQKLVPVRKQLKKKRFTEYIDTSNTAIGKRYVRTDSMGIPFVFTIDFDSHKYNTVTVRERDSTDQIRVSVDKIVEYMEASLRV